MRVEDPPRIIAEQAFAYLQPRRGVGGEPATVKIQLLYFFEPALQLLQLHIVLFKLVVREVVGCRLLGDVSFEVVTFVDEFT